MYKHITGFSTVEELEENIKQLFQQYCEKKLTKGNQAIARSFIDRFQLI